MWKYSKQKKNKWMNQMTNSCVLHFPTAWFYTTNKKYYWQLKLKQHILKAITNGWQ